MKYKLYRFIMVTVQLGYFFAATIVVLPELRKLKNLSYIKVILASMIRIIIIPKRSASFRGLSLPVSSFCHSFPGAAWDARLFNAWYIGRENPVRMMSLVNKLKYYFANLAARSGYISIAWKIYLDMEESNQKIARTLGKLGQFDIAILVVQWAGQLTPFYNSNIWFNPDIYESYNDNLSWLFKKLSPEMVEKLYLELSLDASCLSSVHEMYGEYCESSNRIEDAKIAYSKGLACNPNSKSLKLRRNKVLLLLNEAQENSGLSIFFNPIVAKLIKTSKLCSLFNWKFIKTNEKEKACYSFEMIIDGKIFNRHVELEWPSHGLGHIKNAIRYKGGLVLTHNEGQFYALLDSKHLDIQHLKFFTPQLITFDHNKALIELPTYSPSEVVKKAFVITGNGWNYYHWLFETLPYIELYKTNEYWKNMPLSFQFPLSKWHRETLEILGYDHFEILPHLRKAELFQECIIPVHASRDLIPAPSVVKFLRERLGKAGTVKRGKKVYLCRKTVKAVRGMLNRDEVQQWMIDHGFEIIEPSSLTIREQIEYLSDVDILVAEGGAALSNLIFCPSNAKILIMAASRAWAETFSSISADIGQKVLVVLADSHPKPIPYYLWTAFDYTIDTSDLDVAFEKLINENF